MSGTGLAAGDSAFIDLPSYLARQTREKVNNIPPVTNRKPRRRKLDMFVWMFGIEGRCESNSAKLVTEGLSKEHLSERAEG